MPYTFTSIVENPQIPGTSQSPLYTARCAKCGDWIADFDDPENLERAVEHGKGSLEADSRHLDEIVILCYQCNTEHPMFTKFTLPSFGVALAVTLTLRKQGYCASYWPSGGDRRDRCVPILHQVLTNATKKAVQETTNAQK